MVQIPESNFHHGLAARIVPGQDKPRHPASDKGSHAEPDRCPAPRAETFSAVRYFAFHFAHPQRTPPRNTSWLVGWCGPCAYNSPVYIRKSPPGPRLVVGNAHAADLIGNMVDPASAAGQAILQQVGVGYDEVVFYVSSNLVGKRVRRRLVALSISGDALVARAF